MKPVVAMLNPKGGVGKTTCAINLAGGLAERGLRVLLVDLDDQFYASRWAGFPEGSDNLVHALMHNEDLKPEASALGFDVVPASAGLSTVEGTVSSQRVLRRALRPLLKDYDFVVVDCPGDLDFITLSGLVASNAVVLPMKTGPLEMESICDTVDQVADFLDAEEIAPRLRVLFGMYSSQRKTHQQVVTLIRETLEDDEVFETIIPHRARLEECSAHHKTIFEHASSDSGAQAFRELTDEVIAWLA